MSVSSGATDERVPRTAGARLKRSIGWFLANGALLVFLVVLIIIFSITLPDTFPTSLTLQGILSTKTAILLLALGLIFPLATNNFDISIGYMVALTNSLAMGFQANWQIPWPLACVMVLLIGLGFGCLNGMIVVYAKIDSFIATLASGTILFGLANWYTGGLQISAAPAGKDPVSSQYLGLSDHWLGIPKITWFALVLAIVMWIVLEHLPPGRRFYATGANRRAADLSGIRSGRYIIIAFGLSGLMAAVTGVYLAAQLQIGQATTGPDFLLPAFAAVLLGATSIKPGRVNVWGTVIAVSLLSVAIAGLQQYGAQFYVEDLFNGSMVLIAVGMAGYVLRRRYGAVRGATEAQSQDVGI